MKKNMNYVKPEIEVFDLKFANPLLAGSGVDNGGGEEEGGEGGDLAPIFDLVIEDNV